jgi:hypothetical protein
VALLGPGSYPQYATASNKININPNTNTVGTRSSVAEELGQLPTRSTVELEVRQNPLEGIERIVVDEDGGWHAVDNSPSTRA